MPLPEKQSSHISAFITRAARSERAIPVYRQCPAFEVRTRHGCFAPSSASAYDAISSHQNFCSNASRSAAARRSSGRARRSNPRARASPAAAR